MNARIAIAGIFTESNHLVGRLTTFADFERTELRRGEEILQSAGGVVAGMVAELRDRGARMAPVIFASAVPGGPIEGASYRSLKSELLQRLRAALPVDGILMPQHGAAAVEELGSLDGDLIAAVRELAGPAVPIVATLDCHAHVTAEMVSNADVLLAWETYPHRDTSTTGQRGARLMLDILHGRARPAMAMAKAPVIVGGFMGSTDDGPFAEFMTRTKALESELGVLATSAFLVQPQLDLAGMGGGAVVVTDGDMDRSVRLASDLARAYWDLRFRLETRMWRPADAIRDALGSGGDGTTLLLETSDCIGGGATGDSAWAIRALVEANPPGLSLAYVVDPQAADLCHRMPIGSPVSLHLGHQLDPQWGEPLAVKAIVESLTDGKFTYTGGIWAGLTGDMGPSARIAIGSVRVLVASKGTYDWADEQYRSVGMDTATAQFIVAKNPMNYRVGYAGRYRAAYVLDTPGPTIASMRAVNYQKLQRPYFPKDEHILGFEPVVLRGR